MFRSYFLIAIRAIMRNKIFTLINVIGLSIGICAAIVIYLLVHHDYSFDRFHKDGDRIYRVVSQFDFSGEKFYNSGVTMPLAKAVEGQVPGIEYSTPLYTLGTETKIAPEGSGSKVFLHQANCMYTEPAYFHVLDYEWVAGSPEKSLTESYQVVLSDSKARLYFPEQEASKIVGRQIIINDTILCKVTGVVRSFTENTDITFQVFISWPTLKRGEGLSSWDNTTSASQLFVKLKKGQDAKAIEGQLRNIRKKHTEPDPKDKPVVQPFLLQPLNEIHFDQRFGTYFDNRLASRTTLYGLMIVAGFILLLGCINFINLSTAQSAQRSREIGIRKTMGSSRVQLMLQFITETFVLTLVATLLAILAVPLLLRLLGDLIPPELTFSPLTHPNVLWFLAALMVVVTILAGFYPAWVLSALKPVQILKTRFNVPAKTSGGLMLRKILIVSQFVVAQFFIIAVITVSMQLRYTLNMDPGFRQQGIVYFDTNFNDTIQSKRDVLVSKIRQIPGVTMVSLSNTPIAANGLWTSTIKYIDGTKETETNVQMKMGDTNYIRLYELKLLAGRQLQAADTIREFIINHAYAKFLGFKTAEEVVGKELEWNDRRVPIVGVVADFHQQSLHNAIKPLAISSSAKNQRTFNVGLASGTSWSNTITQIKKAFSAIYPQDNFEYHFQDETVKKYYDNERKTAFLLKWASVLTIVISCLGLLGLVIYSTARRTKEIGIRKVLGASISQVVQVISKEFILLVTLAFVITVPIAYYAITVWLANFAYKVNLAWWLFPGTFVFQVLIALLTVGSQALRAAMISPATTLKTE